MNKKRIYLVLGFLIAIGVAVLIYGKMSSKPENLGTDANNNGIWDDVEANIFARYHDPNIQKAALQGARATQKGIMDPTRGLEFDSEVGKSENCLVAIETDTDKAIEIFRFIEASLTQTKARSDAYLRYNLALSGHVFEGRTPKMEDCSFEVSR